VPTALDPTVAIAAAVAQTTIKIAANPFAAMLEPESSKGKEFQVNAPKKEDFPAIDPKKKTKQQLKDEETKRKQAEMEAQPHKGKPASFFSVERDSAGNPQLTKEQQDFIFLEYMPYNDPEDMVMLLTWLHDYAT
jgi:archaellum component FlaD/FlaE